MLWWIWPSSVVGVFPNLEHWSLFVTFIVNVCLLLCCYNCWLPAKVMYPANLTIRFSWLTRSTSILLMKSVQI